LIYLSVPTYLFLPSVTMIFFEADTYNIHSRKNDRAIFC